MTQNCKSFKILIGLSRSRVNRSGRKLVLSLLGSRTMARSHILTPRQCPGVTFICCRNLIYNLFTHAIKKITKIYPFSLITIVHCYILQNKINATVRPLSGDRWRSIFDTFSNELLMFERLIYVGKCGLFEIVSLRLWESV